MYYGIVMVTVVAFSCATEFIPEINEQLKLVPFTTEFKITMTTIMILDYCGCWIIEKVLKQMFSDFRPKDIAERRPDQLAIEFSRKKEEEEKIEAEKIAALEKQLGKA